MASYNNMELEFCVFPINSLAECLELLTPDGYKKLSDSRIPDEYVISCYDDLHTLGKEYIRKV